MDTAPTYYSSFSDPRSHSGASGIERISPGGRLRYSQTLCDYVTHKRSLGEMIPLCKTPEPTQWCVVNG